MSQNVRSASPRAGPSLKRLQAQVNKTPLPKFQPPKPKVTDGLLTLLKVCDETFATDAFQARSITK